MITCCRGWGCCTVSTKKSIYRDRKACFGLGGLVTAEGGGFKGGLAFSPGKFGHFKGHREDT